jgi:two-component system, cell cycle sensor histidine kinase and response regulator CckA
LQQDEPGLKVIYTSGYSPGMAGKDIALLEGFNFLAKPYPPSKLAQAVRESLDGKAPKKG